MKEKTRVEQAVKACYDAYSDYARKVDNMPMIPKFPEVRWQRGSLKNPNTGWWIDGTLYPGSAEQVIELWDKQRRRVLRRMWKALGVAPEQMPFPEEPSVPAGSGGYM